MTSSTDACGAGEADTFRNVTARATPAPDPRRNAHEWNAGEAQRPQLQTEACKTTLEGDDENPFIAQLVSGTQVAIDPSGYMNGGSDGATASCISSDLVAASPL